MNKPIHVYKCKNCETLYQFDEKLTCNCGNENCSFYCSECNGELILKCLCYDSCGCCEICNLERAIEEDFKNIDGMVVN